MVFGGNSPGRASKEQMERITMNRLTDYLKCLNPKDGTKTHLNVINMTVPQTVEELDTFVSGLAKAMAQSCVDSNQPKLAALACVMTDYEGFMPHLIEKIANNMGRDETKLALSFLAAFGKELFCAEISLLKAKCLADGVGEPTIEWVEEHREQASFARAVYRMNELLCTCPACVMFWSAKRYAEDQMGPADVIKELLEVIEKEEEWGGPGCIRHKIPGAKDGSWAHGEET